MSRGIAVCLFLGLLGMLLYGDARQSGQDAASRDLLADECRHGAEIDEQRRRRDAFARKLDGIGAALDLGQTSLRLAAAAIEAESQKAYPEFLNWLPMAYPGSSNQERIARSLVWRSQLNHERFGTPALAKARQRIEQEFREVLANADPTAPLSMADAPVSR
ncbi:MAG: hypothetical protein L0Y71_17260 [Gemmataceae bacterium]|nr:hypothetical protein [Gemmataceae bacterium]